MRSKNLTLRTLATVVILLLLATSIAQAVPLWQPPNAITISGSPLRIEVGSNMSIQVYHQNYEHGAAYGAADSGPFWYIDGQIYGPNMPNYGSSAAFNTSELTWVDEHTIETRIAQDRYFGGPLGRLVSEANGGAFPLQPGQSLRADGYTVELVEGDARGVLALRFVFDDVPGRSGVHLFWGSRSCWAMPVHP